LSYVASRIARDSVNESSPAAEFVRSKVAARADLLAERSESHAIVGYIHLQGRPRLIKTAPSKGRRGRRPPIEDTSLLETSDHIGAFLRTQREAKGWTQPEAAAKAGIEQSYLSKLELGKSAPSQEVFLRLADAFGFDADTVASQLDDAALAALSDVTAVRSALAATKPGRSARHAPG
jgi:ribosome-binding protein aMBF1 (putative translation factor)